VGFELQSSFIFESQSAFKGSSDSQPLELNSIVDPSWCRHFKQKFLGSATSRSVVLMAFGGGTLLSTLRTTAASLFEGQASRRRKKRRIPMRLF
jgi:hypothetical protein